MFIFLCFYNLKIETFLLLFIFVSNEPQTKNDNEARFVSLKIKKIWIFE